MPFDINRQAKVTSEPNNPGRQSVECLAYFFLEQLRQGNISNEQFKVYDHAHFERLKKKNHPSVANTPIYDNRPEVVTTKKEQLLRKINRNLENPDVNEKELEEVISNLEYLMKKEFNVSGKGDEKFLRVVNKLGFNLEFYATFRKRALVNWTEGERERARQARLHNKINPEARAATELDLQPEINRLQAVYKHALDEPAKELLPYAQAKDPNRPTLKLYFEDSGFADSDQVSFEFPTANPIRVGAAADPVPMFGFDGIGIDIVDDEDPIQRHKRLIGRKAAIKARGPSGSGRFGKTPAAAASAAPVPAAAASAALSPAPDSKSSKDSLDSSIAYRGSVSSLAADQDDDYRDCKDEKDVAELTTAGKAAAFAAAAAAPAAVNRKDRGDIVEEPAAVADRTPKDYRNNGNIFGTYYDSPKILQPGEDIQAQRPSFAQSLTVLVGVFGAFLTKIIEVIMGFSEDKSKNANPHRDLDSEELQKEKADLFDDYRKKLTDEAVRNKLVEDWRAAKTAAERDQVIESLKDKLASAADVDLSEDLQTLNFKLCLRKLDDVKVKSEARRAPSAGAAAPKAKWSNEKSYLSRLWRGGWHHLALNRLHGFMAEEGLYFEMDESLRGLEYAIKDKGLLAHPGMREAQALYGKILEEIHCVDLREASEIDHRFPKQCYEVRQAMLNAIAKTELDMDTRIKDDPEVKKLQSEYAQKKTGLEQLEAQFEELQKAGKIEKDVADRYNAMHEKTKNEKAAAEQMLRGAEGKIRRDFAIVLKHDLEKIKRDNIDADKRKVQVDSAVGSAGAASVTPVRSMLPLKDMLKRISEKQAKAAAEYPLAKRMATLNRDFPEKRITSAAAASLAASASGGVVANALAGRGPHNRPADGLRDDINSGTSLASSSRRNAV